MSLLSQVKKGRIFEPPRVLVYGPHGIGKSSFAAGAPAPIFISTEDGLSQIDCDKFPLCRSYADVLAQITELGTVKHDYQTVVIDTIDWLEKLIWAEVCRKECVATLEKIGYGKGPKMAADLWFEVINALDWLRKDHGMAWVLVAHSAVKSFADPEGQPYDQYQLRIDARASSVVLDAVDTVLFCCKRTRTEKQELGFNQERHVAKAVGGYGGEREMRTVGGPSCLAKNRYHLPEKIELSWQPFQNGVNQFYGISN